MSLCLLPLAQSKGPRERGPLPRATVELERSLCPWFDSISGLFIILFHTVYSLAAYEASLIISVDIYSSSRIGLDRKETWNEEEEICQKQFSVF